MQGELFSNNLAYFVVLYETLDYSAAARSLPMSYQGLRKAILKLEQDLGTELFEHDASGHLHPTEYAELLYEQTERWNADMAHLEKQFARISELSRKNIYIGFANVALPFMGYDAVVAFEKRYPHLTLKIVEDYSTVINQAVRDGEYPFAVTTGPFDENVELTELARGSYSTWINKRHPLASRSTIKFDDFANETVVILPEEEKGSATFSQTMAAQVPSVDFLHVSDLFWTLAHVMMGSGIGIGIDWLDGIIRSHTDIAVVPIECELQWSIGLTRRAGAVLNEDEMSAMNFVREWFEKRAKPFDQR